MTSTHSHYDNMSSDDSSFDWSSDSGPRSKRKSPRKTKSTNDSTNVKHATDGPIKKAKKPGRKPLAKVTVLPSDPKLKRKAQNRAAQRAFRERKEQFVNELQDQMRELQVAKDKREKELAKENARLKKENERLKEENYILKDAKFTFEFPQQHKQQESDKLQPTTMISPPITDDQVLSSSSLPTSPLSDAPVAELSDYHDNTSADSLPATSFHSITTTTTPPEFSFSRNTDNSDLFGGKDNLFLTDYRAPVNESDFLIQQQNQPLPQLFGNEMDIFGVDSPTPFNTTELDSLFSDEIQQLVQDDTLLQCAPENEKPCKTKILAVLDRARGANRSMYQINQDVKSYCPNINLDQLCEDLKRKITFDSNHILTDADVDLYIECIQRTTSK